MKKIKIYCKKALPGKSILKVVPTFTALSMPIVPS
jgi:hypothetical protein